ncbi:hypothetical protein N7495_005275 [Penicillium taxi]|uniref:uncharacterized protein n=1 Tax=Penicillium taxi TaxID=168475 RepID=UPI002545023B|nr:uncharacterized protein N7495_005275 [Penicillium taxi]KAJ5893584.1 hypothetical protein N7495_005275 [Penicillium taxi]
MAEARDSQLPYNGSTELPSFNEDEDLEEEHDSPPTKRRRTGSVSAVEASIELSLPLSTSNVVHSLPATVQHSPVHKVEGDLDTAFSDSVLDSMAPIKTPRIGTENIATPNSTFESPNSPDVRSMISNIMDFTERSEETVAMGPQTIPAEGDFPGSTGHLFLKASTHLKIQSLPILDNLATQILSFLSKNSYSDLTTMITEPGNENGQAYAVMRSLFDHTKRVYIIDGSFLKPKHLEFTDQSQLDIFRKANLASFVSSLFGSQEIGFSELNEYFLDVFVPEGGRLLKGQAALYLELKTQVFISGMNSKSCTRTQLLYKLFPEDMEELLLARRPGSRQLAPSETDFVQRLTSRREHLLHEVDNPEAMKSLPDKYHWEDFLRDLAQYISKNFDTINTQPGKKTVKGRQQSISEESATQESPTTTHQGQFSVNMPVEVPVDRNMHGDLVARAARAAHIALQGVSLRRSQEQSQMQHQHQQRSVSQASTPHPQQNQQPAQQQVQQPQADSAYVGGFASVVQPQYPNSALGNGNQEYHHYTPPNPGQTIHGRNNVPANPLYMPGIPHISQSQPTQVLYEQARQAASIKSSSPASRKSGLPSQRRPWTTEEENALMAGLDRVKGPHWSQILIMFGPGGSISEALKDRNQVQLKDKARNLKLFFLKSGIEVPYYLQFVTGELKTRAPAQAAKREARERQKKQGEEDKAHVEGIKGMMALAGAHAPPVGSHEMSASPGLPPDPNSQAALDQTADQKLMQTLSQEVHGNHYSQHNPAPTQDHLDQHMQMQQ